MPKFTMSDPSKSPPMWMGDFGGREHLLAMPMMLDPAQFRKPDAVVVTVATGGAAIGATTVPVTALSGKVPSGTILDFTGAGKFARLTADAAAGATALTVEALPEALVAGNTATYAGSPTRLKAVPSGRAIGRTLAERDTSPPVAYGPAVDTDDEIFLIAFEVADADNEPYAVAYRHGGLVKENYLPNWGSLDYWPAALVTKLRALYQFTKGTD